MTPTRKRIEGLRESPRRILDFTVSEVQELCNLALSALPASAPAESDLMERITPGLARKITEVGNSLDSADDGERVAKALQGADDGCTFNQVETIDYEAEVKKRYPNSKCIKQLHGHIVCIRKGFGSLQYHGIGATEPEAWKSAYKRMGGKA